MAGLTNDYVKIDNPMGSNGSGSTADCHSIAS